MKKLSLLLLAITVSLCVQAGNSFNASHNVRANKMADTGKSITMVKNFKGAPSRVITERPEGELRSYLRTSNGLYPDGNNIYSGEQLTDRVDIVFANGGKVYLKNILYNTSKTWGIGWGEGQLNDAGTEITVPMGQSLYYSYTYQADILLAWGTTQIAYRDNGEAYIDFIIDDRMTEVVYTIDGETITGPEGMAPVDDGVNPYWNFEGTGLGSYWTDDLSFAGALEWNSVMTETEPYAPPTVITEQPEGTLYTLSRNSGFIVPISGEIYNGVTEGDLNFVLNEEEGKAYIQNPLWWHDYGYWVEGTYDPESGIIIIPTGQYIYYNEDMEYGIQLMWGSTAAIPNENGGYSLEFEVDDETEEICFWFYDNNLYLIDSNGDATADFPDWGNATGMMGVYSNTGIMTFIEFANSNSDGEMLPFAQFINTVPAVPANPTIDEWIDGGDEEGNSMLFFTLPTTDINGNLINPQCLSFSIFVDNGNGPEIFTFEADTYVNDLWDDMTEIPYELYANGWDISGFGCIFYRTNQGDNPLFTDNIGIQAYYEVDGEKNASDIVWLYDHDTSVDEINAGKTVADVRYYNVAGQQVAQPSGLTIKVTTYTDGTTSATKVVK